MIDSDSESVTSGSTESEADDEGHLSSNTICPCDFDFTDATRRLDLVTFAWLKEMLGTAIELINSDGAGIARVGVRIVGDAEMASAHTDYSGVEGTTDVLGFVTDQSPLRVDVLICLDEASRRASEFEHDLGRELLLYVVHAVLHATGHDDHDPESFQRMHEEEDRILRAIGVGSVFKPNSAGDTPS
jgi:rRNA maturation RNase YbeY